MLNIICLPQGHVFIDRGIGVPTFIRKKISMYIYQQDFARMRVTICLSLARTVLDFRGQIWLPIVNDNGHPRNTGVWVQSGQESERCAVL